MDMAGAWSAGVWRHRRRPATSGVAFNAEGGLREVTRAVGGRLVEAEYTLRG